MTTPTPSEPTVEEVLNESGDYAACPYCCEVWSNEMLRDDKRMPVHNFGEFRATCAGSGEFPVAPTVQQVSKWKQEQQS